MKKAAGTFRIRMKTTTITSVVTRACGKRTT